MIAFGGIIGAGLFVGAGGAIQAAGPGVLLTYAGTGLLVFLVMRMLGEMATSGQGGSFAEYTARALGPWAGRTTRWLFWYFWIFTVGAEAVIGASLLKAAGLPGPLWLLSTILLCGMTGLNLLSVKIYGDFEIGFAILKVLAIAVFIAVGTAFLAFLNDGRVDPVQNLLGHGGIFPNGALGLLTALPIVVFSMVGSEVATIAAAESNDPAGNVVRAGRTVALRILGFYVGSVALLLLIRPWSAFESGVSPFIPVLEIIGIPYVEEAMMVVIITAVLSCLNSGIYITSRMLFELAASGAAPQIAKQTTAAGVPVIAILVTFGFGMVAVLAQFLLSADVFTALASTCGDIILFIYGIIAVAQIQSRKKLEAAGQRPAVAMWLFPWLSYIVVGAIVVMLTLLFFLPSQRMTLLLSLATFLTVLAGSIISTSRTPPAPLSV